MSSPSRARTWGRDAGCGAIGWTGFGVSCARRAEVWKPAAVQKRHGIGLVPLRVMDDRGIFAIIVLDIFARQSLRTDWLLPVVDSLSRWIHSIFTLHDSRGLPHPGVLRLPLLRPPRLASCLPVDDDLNIDQEHTCLHILILLCSRIHRLDATT